MCELTEIVFPLSISLLGMKLSLPLPWPAKPKAAANQDSFPLLSTTVPLAVRHRGDFSPFTRFLSPFRYRTAVPLRALQLAAHAVLTRNSDRYNIFRCRENWQVLAE